MIDGVIVTKVYHNGQHDGYLYKVVIDDAAKDVMMNPHQGAVPGDSIVSTRNLPVQLIEDVPVYVDVIVSNS